MIWPCEFKRPRKKFDPDLASILANSLENFFFNRVYAGNDLFAGHDRSHTLASKAWRQNSAEDLTDVGQIIASHPSP